MSMKNSIEHLISEEDLDRGRIIVIDKPYEWTSFDVVNRVRSLLRRKFDRRKLKVGHAGTLDPLATGVLVIGIGPATKELHRLQSDVKEYEGTIMLGANTPSYDRETEPDEFFSYTHITEEDVKRAMKWFVGRYDQYPPAYSAIKRGGKKMYELVREDKKVKPEARKVTIFKFEPLEIDIPMIKFFTRVSKGTYVRSLAYDLGKKLGTGGYLYDLRRIKSGKYSIEDAVKLDEWIRINEIPTD